MGFEIRVDCPLCVIEGARIETWDGDLLESLRCRYCDNGNDLAAWAREEGLSSATELVEAYFVLPTLAEVQTWIARKERVETTFDLADYLFSGGGAGGAAAAEPALMREEDPEAPKTQRIPQPLSIRRLGGPHDELLALAAVAAADGEAGPDDLAVLVRAAEKRALPPLPPEEIRVRRPNEIDPPPTLQDRERVLEEMFQMAWSDGQMDESEMRVIREFARTWGIDPVRLSEWTELYSFTDANALERWFRRIGLFLFPQGDMQQPPYPQQQPQNVAPQPAQNPNRERIALVGQQFRTVLQNVERVILGKTDVIARVLAAMCAGGHVLLLDVPGVGKTMLARSIAASIYCSFKRIQFTPDLLPLDITGNNIFNLRKKAFEFVPGPVFANLLLADEINRATPKTQAALLEVMAEGQVTVDGTTHVLPQPFLVLATMNPLEHDGTFPLPAAQLDRFTIRISMGFPPPDAEMRMLDVHMGKDVAISALQPVLGQEEFLAWQRLLPSIYVAESVKRHAVNIVTAMRQDSACLTPPSPRATLMWLRMAMAIALLEGRDHLLPNDLQRTAVDVLAHRIIVSGQRSGGGYVDHVIRQVPVER